MPNTPLNNILKKEVSDPLGFQSSSVKLEQLAYLFCSVFWTIVGKAWGETWTHVSHTTI